MIPTVTNNHLNDSSITSKNFKRHTDPPWLWTFVCIGSVSLHLLVFWLMRSSNEFQAWFPQSNQSSIPIDLIEIASEPKSQIKTQSTTRKIKPQSSFSTSPKSASVKLSNQDDADSSVNLPEQDKSEKPKVEKPEVRKLEVEKTEVEKTEVEKLPVRQQSYPTNPTPEPTSIIPESERPWNSRQEVKLGEGTLLPKDIPADSPTPTTEPSLTANRGGAIATVSPILKEEVSELIQQKQLIADALPDVLAEYKGSTEKELEASILPSDEDLKPANILASLIIDKNGQFQQAIVITIEPAALRSQANIYEQALNQMFAQESFLAAYNQDGSKPDLSNLYIRLKIKPINSP
ncbi:MAG: hypothetical protein ACK4YK_03740 [Dolichospermum sp.]